MVHEVAGTRVRVALVAMVLGVAAFVTCLAAAFWGKVSPGRAPQSLTPFFAKSDTFLVDLLSSPLLQPLLYSAKNCGEKSLSLIGWDEQLQMNVHLDPNKTHISVEEEGFYLVFVQITFKVPRKMDKDLSLRVNLHYPEGEDQVAAVFHTHQAMNCTEPCNEVDVVLSQPVLLKVTKGDNFTVWAEPRELIDCELRPAPSFLTLVKVSNLKDGRRKEVVKRREDCKGRD
ncbi:hypothetical protein GN956_G23770 [Arapaima gigas]